MHLLSLLQSKKRRQINIFYKKKIHCLNWHDVSVPSHKCLNKIIPLHYPFKTKPILTLLLYH